MAWRRPLVQLWLEWNQDGFYTCCVETVEMNEKVMAWRRETELKVSRTEVHLLSDHSGVSIAYCVCTWGAGHQPTWNCDMVCPACFLIRSQFRPSWLAERFNANISSQAESRLEAAAVISKDNCNDVGAVGSANDLTGFLRRLTRLILITVGFGPQLLMKILHHPLQVLPGLPFLQQVST